MRPFLILMLILLGRFGCLLGQDADSSAIKKKEAEQFFQRAKTELDAFESEHGHFIQTVNGRMHYLTYGNKKGLPLIWCGGSGMNAYELMMFNDELVNAGYYLITLDYYGQGKTPIPGREVSVWHVADDIKAILDELKIKKAVIGGWSRGGTITTAFYDAYPDRCLGLVLEDGGSVSWNANAHKTSVEEIERKTRERFEKEKPEPLYDSEFNVFQSANPNADNMRRALFILNGISQDPSGKWGQRVSLSTYYCEDNAENKLKITLRTMDAPLYAASAQMVEPRIIYRNLDVPMIIFDPVMENDTFEFTQGNQALRKTHPELIEHKIYENTPHHLKFVRREAFLKDMSEFLNRVKNFHKV